MKTNPTDLLTEYVKFISESGIKVDSKIDFVFYALIGIWKLLEDVVTKRR